MGFRLLLLMVMGLGAMYMMHLLAQDWNKIRQPVQQAAKLVTSASATMLQLQRRRRHIHDELNWIKNTKTLTSSGSNAIDWERILSRDPFECLQSLICQVMSGAENEAEEAILLMNFLEATLQIAPAKIGRSFSRGLVLRGNTERCYEDYPFCLYSAKVMLRILRWFSSSQDHVDPVNKQKS